MHIQITAKNIELTDAIRSYAEKKVEKLKKYLDQKLEVSVLLEVQKNLHIVEILVSANGVFMKGLEKSEDLYASIDLAVDKIDKQLVRYKERLKDKKLIEKDFEKPLRLNILDNDSVENQEPRIIVSKDMTVKPMDLEEAVMQMDLLNKSFFVFRNALSNVVNVVYRRDDGNIGLIEP